jgi:hypothetical protein
MSTAAVGSLGAGASESTAGLSPAMQAFIDKAHNDMLEAVKQAKDSLQPAEMASARASSI